MFNGLFKYFYYLMLLKEVETSWLTADSTWGLCWVGIQAVTWYHSLQSLHQVNTAALVSMIFFLQFCTARGSREVESIFICIFGVNLESNHVCTCMCMCVCVAIPWCMWPFRLRSLATPVSTDDSLLEHTREAHFVFSMLSSCQTQIRYLNWKIHSYDDLST